MISVPLLVLACVLIALGRLQIRRVRRAATATRLRRLWGWAVLGVGFLCMLMGVLLW